MGTFFVLLYKVFKKQRIIFFGIILLFVFIALYNLKNLSLYDDFNQIFPQSEDIEVYNEVLSNSRLLDRIVLHFFLEDSLAKPDPELLSRMAGQLRDSVRLSLVPEYVSDIQPDGDDQLFFKTFDFFYEFLPFFMDSLDYKWLKENALQESWLDEQMAKNYRSLIAPTGMVTRDFILKDPLHIVIAKTALMKDMQMDDNLEMYDDFLLTRDAKSLMFFIQPQDAGKTSDNEVFIDAMEKYINALETEYPGVKIDMYGSVPVAIANTRQIKKDIQLTVSLAFVLLIILMTSFYRKKRSVVLIFIPVLFGALIAISFFSFFKPDVSAISLAIGAVILGVAVDFSLHFLTHRKHSGSVEKTLKDIAEPVMMSSLTTATAFLCLLFISSPALRDMGIFAAISVVASALGALLLLPHLVSNNESGDKKKSDEKTGLIEGIASVDWHRKKILVSIVVLCAAILIYMTRFTGFEDDLEESAYVTKELADADKRLKELTSITEQTVYVMAEGKDLNESLEKNQKLVKHLGELIDENKIQSYHTIQKLLPTLNEQRTKIDQWNYFWKENRMPLQKKVMKAGEKHGFNEEAFRGLFAMVEKDYQPIRPEEMIENIAFVAEDFIIRTQHDRVFVTNLVKVESEKSRMAVYEKIEQLEDAFVFDRKNMAERLFELLKKDFNQLIRYSLIIVFFIIYLFFGRIELAILTFFPMLLSWLCTMGVMGMFDVKFNIFNVVITSFIFGLGIDYAIFITKGYLQEVKYGERTIISYKSSILVSSFTTLIGFGVLIVAKHPALQSIGVLSMIGIVSVVLITFTLQPLLVSHLFYLKNGKKRSMPITINQLIYSSYAFLFFAIISIVLTTLVPVFIIIPIGKQRKRRWFRYLVYLSCKGVVLTSWVTKNEFTGINKKTFEKPSVLVSNHQSVTDLLYYMGTSPKIIILTKDWVWNNFFFGLIVRFAGYINISEGYDKVLPKIQSSLERGETIIVFPEGSRTRTGKIRRFHKGAFYLAEKLQAPVTAVLLDGYFDVLPPGHFFVNNGVMTMKFLKRFNPEELEGGYSLVAKNMCRYFREEQQKLRREKMQFKNFRPQLVKKYIYKGPAVEYYVKVKLWAENYYQLLEPLIPHKARVMDMGCGYGMLANMLTLTSPEREVKGVDFDENKINIAINTIEKKQRLSFEVADLTDFISDKRDVFILSDVLHYLPLSLQEIVLERCLKNLLPKGTIIIRDGNSELKKKHLGTRFTEIISTRSGFNKKRYPLSYLSVKNITEFAEKHDMTVTTIDRTKLTSNQIFVLKRNQQ